MKLTTNQIVHRKKAVNLKKEKAWCLTPITNYCDSGKTRNFSVVQKNFFLSLPVFLIAPLGVIIFHLFSVVLSRGGRRNDANLLVLMVLISAYIGMVAVSREIRGDQVEYLYFFNLAADVSLSDYFRQLPQRDWVYWFFTYAVSRYTPLNHQSFFFIIAFAGSFALMAAARKSCDRSGVSEAALIFLIVFAFGLNADIFVWSMQLIRQILALSLAVYGLVHLYSAERMSFFVALLLLFSSLIHAIAGLVVLFGLLVFYFSLRGLAGRLIPALAVISLIYFSDLFLNFLNYWSSFLFERSIWGSDKTDIVSKQWVLPQLVVFLNIGMGFYAITKKRVNSYAFMSAHLLLYYNTFILLITYMPGLQLFSYRLIIVSFFFPVFLVPLVLSDILRSTKGSLRHNLFPIFAIIVFLWVARFFHTVGGNYGYPDALTLMVNPLISFF